MKLSNKKIRLILSALLLICLIFVVKTFIPSKFVTINKIECKSQQNSCNSEVVNKLQSLQGENLYSVKRNLEVILDDEIIVKNYNLQFKFPGTLEVLLVEKKPEFALTTYEKKDFHVIDDSGNVLFKTTTTELPIVLVQEMNIEKGGKVKSEILFALELVKDLNLTLGIKEGKVEDRSLLIELPDNLTIIFPIEGDREVLIGSLILLYNEFQSETGKEKFADIASIDLRFKNPVLRVN